MVNRLKEWLRYQYWSIRWDVTHAHKCPHIWFTSIPDSTNTLFHSCRRNRFHRGAHRDRLGLNSR